MERTELFLLLAEYKEADKTCDYINCIDIFSEEEVMNYLKKISDIKQFFEHEKYDGYYDSQNINAFLEPINLLEECYPNQKTGLRLLLKSWGEDWRTCKEQCPEDCYQYLGCLNINDESLSEIAKRQDTNKQNAYLLINHNAITGISNQFIVKYNSTDVYIHVQNPEIKEIAQWFEINRRPKRIFKLNPKHGENGKGAHRTNKGDKVSILYCSRGEAYTLLKKAVGVDASTKTLFYFDKKNNKYIEFKYEIKNTYHGFHLENEDISRVPATVISKIKMLED